MKALEVKEDGQIWLIPDCPEEPKYMSADEKEAYLNSVEGFEDAEAGLHGRVDLPINKSLYQYQTELASAERILVSNQGTAAGTIYIHHKDCMTYNSNLSNGVKPGIYPIPDLKWNFVCEVCEECPHNYHPCPEGCSKKVAVISPPLEQKEDPDKMFKEWIGEPQEDEKNGMYEDKPFADFSDAISYFIDRNCLRATISDETTEETFPECDIRIHLNGRGGGYIHLLNQDSDTIDFRTMDHYKLTNTPKPEHLR